MDMRRFEQTSMLNRVARRGACTLVGLLVLLALPAAASAQQDRIARLREAYSVEAMARIESIVTEARQAGVPVGPIYNKALEGAAKGHPANLVVPVLSEFVGRNEKVVIGCYGEDCPYAAHACAKAVAWEYTQVNYFAGGFQAWSAAGYPVEDVQD